MIIVVVFILSLALIWLGMLAFALAFHLWPLALVLSLYLFYREYNRHKRWREDTGC